jgi:hypothetical protein
MRAGITAVLLAAFAVVLRAQTPQKIIDDYLQAAGGQKALAQIRPRPSRAA